MDGVPLLIVAGAVRDDTGQVLGVIAAAIDPSHLQCKILGMDRGRGSIVDIIDPQGRLVSSDPHMTLPWAERIVRDDGPLQKALAGEMAMGITRVNLLPGKYIVSRVPVGKTGFVASAGQSVDQVLGPLWTDVVITLITSLVVIGGAVGIAVWISRRINRGLRGLTEHAAAVAAGDFDHRAQVTDITELQLLADAFNRTAEQRKAAEMALRQSELKFRSLAENAQAVIGIVQGRRYLYANPYLSTLSGYTREELLTIDIGDMVHPDFREMVLDRAHLRQEGAAAPDHYEFKMVTKSGEHRWIDLSPTAITVDGKVAVIGVAYDITDRKIAQQQLQELNETLEQRVVERTAVAEHRAQQLREMAVELTRTEERERRRLARIVHDDLQQVLAAVKFHAGAMEGRLESETLRQRLRQMIGLVDESIKVSRGLTTALSPPILYDAGLGPAMSWLARWMQTRHGLAVRVVGEEKIDPISEDIRIFLFQAVRELLFNCARHAGANEATIELKRNDGFVEIVVGDEGIGFDPKSPIVAGNGTGFGLFSIGERIEVMGGSMQIHSAPGLGTRVTLRMRILPFRDPSV